MQVQSFRRVAAYALCGASVIAFAYSVWLGGVLLSALAQTGTNERADIGNGVFLLIYAALPATVALMSLSYLVGDRSRRNSGIVLTALAFLLASVQLIWLLDFAPRAAREPATFAFGATATVVALAVANLRTTAGRTR